MFAAFPSITRSLRARLFSTVFTITSTDSEQVRPRTSVDTHPAIDAPTNIGIPDVDVEAPLEFEEPTSLGVLSTGRNGTIVVEDNDQPASQATSDSASPVIKRRRITSKEKPNDGAVIRVSSQSDAEKQDEDGNICVICMEPWANTGPHQICCMPCGHVFGYHCIKHWLSDNCHRVCPTCKTPGRIRDLRLLFGVPATLQTADVSEVEGLRKNLDQERNSHALTRDKLRENQRLISSLRKSLKEYKRKADSGAGVATFGDRRKVLEGLQSVCTYGTNGGTQTAVFDTEARVLFAEKQSDNFYCVRRLDVRRALSPTTPRYMISKQVTDICVNTYAASSAFAYVAATSRSRTVHILDKELKQAAVLSTAAVPTSCTWLSSITCGIAVGFMTGEVCVYDIRSPSNGALFQANVDSEGWRYVHSLGELRGEQAGLDGSAEPNTVLLAGAPKGLYATCFGALGESFELISGTVRHEGEQICGMTADDGLVAVGFKDQDGGSIAIHRGLRRGRRGFKLAESVGSRIRGVGVEGAFTRVGLLNSGDAEGRDVFVVSPDSFSKSRVSCWSSTRLNRGDLEWRRADASRKFDDICASQSARELRDNVGAFRGVCMASLPRLAKLDPLPRGSRGLACFFGDKNLSVYTCGRHETS